MTAKPNTQPAELADRLQQQMRESVELDLTIRKNLEVLSYGE